MTPPALIGPGCRDCGNRPADTWLSEVGPLCDRCADDRLVAATGLPPLPDPPDPVVLTGPHGRTHRMRYRIFRAPTGISLRLLEDTEPADRGGYEFAILGDHDADVGELAAALHTEAAAEIGRCYLEFDEPDHPYTAGEGGAGEFHPGGRLQIADTEVAGRFTYDPTSDGPHAVVIDGRFLTWAELGAMLESFEGWRFRLLIDDPTLDHRTTGA
jgi:hypothetical protein